MESLENCCCRRGIKLFPGDVLLQENKLFYDEVMNHITLSLNYPL